MDSSWLLLPVLHLPSRFPIMSGQRTPDISTSSIQIHHFFEIRWFQTTYAVRGDAFELSCIHVMSDIVTQLRACCVSQRISNEVARAIVSAKSEFTIVLNCWACRMNDEIIQNFPIYVELWDDVKNCCEMFCIFCGGSSDKWKTCYIMISGADSHLWFGFYLIACCWNFGGV